MWHVSAPHRICIGHRTGYSLHENARISGLASADFEGVFAHAGRFPLGRLEGARVVNRLGRARPKLEASHSAVRALSVSAYNRGCMWHVSPPIGPVSAIERAIVCMRMPGF